jgi:signal transduction histidine kinase
MTRDAIDILLVDDEPRNLDALEAILAGPAYRLIRATGSDEALQALLAHDVAAIVLDIQMPGVSGVELAQIIKGTKKFREVPILFLTAHLMEDQDVIAGYGAGAVDYLTKPANPQILRHKIAVFAELFRKTRALAELNATLESRVQERTAELERSEAALRAADKQKDVFLATLAHELRNPLAPLRMGVDLLLHGGSPESNARTLQVMNRQLDHMVRLIDDLLDVARISGGKLELKKAKVDVADTVQGVLETWRLFFNQRGQSVTARLDGAIFASADPTRLAQIIGNLLHNAAKFSPDGASVRVDLTRENGQAVIRVTDAGIGIVPGQLSRVFDMFARVDHPSAATTSSASGLGIGLALSRRLAEMHDGALTVESAGVGQGSVFSLSLPALDDGVTEAAGPAAVARAGRDELVKLVLIEDNVDAAELLAAWLEGRRYEVVVAHTGPAGLEAVDEARPSIVLCDIGLPGIDGNEVCRRVRALDPAYRPVMIALTGWGMKDDMRRTEEAGFDHHLVKPVDPALLFAILDGAR